MPVPHPIINSIYLAAGDLPARQNKQLPPHTCTAQTHAQARTAVYARYSSIQTYTRARERRVGHKTSSAELYRTVKPPRRGARRGREKRRNRAHSRSTCARPTRRACISGSCVTHGRVHASHASPAAAAQQQKPSNGREPYHAAYSRTRNIACEAHAYILCAAAR